MPPLSREPPVPPSPRRAVAVSLAAGLIALSAVGGVLAVVQHRSAVTEAIRDARWLTELQARDVVEPVLTDAALRPGPAQAALHEVISKRVLSAHVVRVKIWDAEGRIVYSDDADLIGRQFALPPDELAALGPGGVPVAEVSDLQEDENREDREFGKLLQVYLGVRTAEGTPLLFETYHPYGSISQASRRLWMSFLPVLLGGLALLWLAQAPLAWRMATGLLAAHDEREQLLVAALAASDRERQRIAADLHDGVVQGLSGASYLLSAEAGRVRQRGDELGAATLGQLAVDLRRCVRELRSLVVTITPPGLHRQALEASIRDLVAPLEDRGIAVVLDVPDDVELDQPSVDLVLRTTQEAVRNILRHAEAHNVSVTVRSDDGHLTVSIRDDGIGFHPGPGAGRHDSVGLSLLAGLAQQEGGRLDVRSTPAHGAHLELVLPRRPQEKVLL